MVALSRGWGEGGMPCASVSPEDGSPETALFPSPARNLCVASPPSSLEAAVPSPSPRTAGEAVPSRVEAVLICNSAELMSEAWLWLACFLSLGSSSPVQILPRSEPTSSGRSCPRGLAQAPQTQPVPKLIFPHPWSSCSLRQCCVNRDSPPPPSPLLHPAIHKAQLMLSSHPQQTLNFLFCVGV